MKLSFLGLLSGLLILPTAAVYGQAGPVDISQDGDHIRVSIGGQLFTNFYTGDPYPKPFLHPLVSADGRAVTRGFPVVTVAGETQDHPHHRGLFIGYGDINGINFWENEKAYTTPNRGTMILTAPAVLKSGAHEGTIEATFSWRDPKGLEILIEHRLMTFSGTADQRVVDVDFTFTAVQDLHFGDTKEGFFAIRVADTITEDKGGQMLASSGFTKEAGIWGRPSEWVQYTGTVDKRTVSITIFDHPKNLNHPERWHARGYGLFAVNPFGLKEFDKYSTQPGGFFVKAGSAIRFRYRVMINDTPLSAEQEKTAYSAWAAN
jgi:hypothetical protein